MIVHDEATLRMAGDLLYEIYPTRLRFKDQYNYLIVKDEDVLEKLARKALKRGDIVIVAPVGEEASMEEHGRSLTRIRRQRKEAEEEAMKRYIKEHPEEIKALVDKWEKQGVL